VCDFCSAEPGRKARFEALAEVIAEYVIAESHCRYQPGWITRGGDKGIDLGES